jgi:uncharacterized membrane protein (DUF2068 family)
MKRPLGITILAIGGIIFGIIYIPIGLLGFPGPTAELARALPPTTATNLNSGQLIISSTILIILGALFIVFGIGALHLRFWSWILGVTLAGILLIDGIYGLVTLGNGGHEYIVGIVCEVIILAYLFRGSVRQAFSAVHHVSK